MGKKERVKRKPGDPPSFKRSQERNITTSLLLTGPDGLEKGRMHVRTWIITRKSDDRNGREDSK